MAQIKEVMLGATLVAAAFGVTGHAAPIERGMTLSNSVIVIAADDAAPDAADVAPDADQGAAPVEDNIEGSAKMGEDPGTHTGNDLGATPENDTSKVEQPVRRDPTTGGAGDKDQ
jgi:hypothetical protein